MPRRRNQGRRYTVSPSLTADFNHIPTDLLDALYMGIGAGATVEYFFRKFDNHIGTIVQDRADTIRNEQTTVQLLS